MYKALYAQCGLDGVEACRWQKNITDRKMMCYGELAHKLK